MNNIKKYLGILWMAAGPASIIFLITQAAKKLGNAAATTNDWLQWSIIVFIFTPIAIGLVIFGWYSWNGEYDKVE
jgi:hypothetical protein